MRKRGPGSVENPFVLLEAERAAKRPANASTRSDLMSSDASVAHGGMVVGNTNEGPASWEGERLDSMSPISLEAGAAGMSMEPAHVKTEQTSAEMMRPLASENKTAASTRVPVTDGPWARPRSESMDHSVHRGYRQSQGNFSPGAYGVQCRACGSGRHMTKECYVPSKDGTVPMCPFHDCSVLGPYGSQSHPLDGHKDYNPADRVKIPQYCSTVLKYKTAVRDKHTAKIRSMLPHLFQNLVIDRRRKPCCRVVSKEVCFINLTIQYSVQFCDGRMPAKLEGIWPYTTRDATNPAICAKLQRLDELGWKGMPKGELEFKSWEEIKSEYDKGIMPPQIHSKHRPLYLTSTAMPTAAGLDDTEAHLHAPGADLERRAVDEDSGGQGSLMQEGAVQPQDTVTKDVLLQMFGVLSEKIDEKFDALSEKVDALCASHEKVDAIHALLEKSNADSEKKKDALDKILDVLS